MRKCINIYEFFRPTSPDPLPPPTLSLSTLHSLCSRPTWSPFLTLFTIIEKLFAALCELLPSPLRRRAATSSTFYQHSKIKINIALWIQTHTDSHTYVYTYIHVCRFLCLSVYVCVGQTYSRVCVCATRQHEFIVHFSSPCCCCCCCSQFKFVHSFCNETKRENTHMINIIL